MRSYESIMKRMLDRIPNKYDKRETSVIYMALAPAGAELAQMYIELETVMRETFADTASYENLRKRAKERGIYPFEATNAILKAEFNQKVNIGSRFAKDNLTYIVTRHIEDFNYEIMCEQKGTMGNQYFGSIIPVEYIEGLTKAEITELLIPARDLEDVEAFRERYFDSFDSQAFGGNIKDYKEKTMALDGVGAVQVIPVWQGGGTVKLIILDGELNVASDLLVENVQNEIDPIGHSGLGLGLAPIGHKVTVTTANEMTININSDIILSTGFTWESVKLNIEENINLYFNELKENWGELEREGIIVRISHIENRILNTDGVVDVSNTKLNNKPGNIQLKVDEIPVLGGITNERN